jgi:hypothetical protein
VDGDDDLIDDYGDDGHDDDGDDLQQKFQVLLQKKLK